MTSKKDTSKMALSRLLGGASADENWFAPSFLAALSLEEVDILLRRIRKTLGAFNEVRETGKALEVIFDGGVVPTEVSTDGQGLITRLLLHPPRVKHATIESSVAAFTALTGRTALLVTRNDEVLVEKDADLALNVGSAFKLAVLSALLMHTPELDWARVILLQPEARSLPSGIMHSWPPLSPVTLHTLATLMISISDNTATDQLISFVGRDIVEDFTRHSRPLLTTREAFRASLRIESNST